MQSVNLSLTDAFKIRQTLKRCISANQRELFKVPPFYDAETEKKTHVTICRKYGSIEELMNLVTSEFRALGDLNTAIDKANVGIRPMLNQIEVLQQKISLYENLTQSIENAESVRTEHTEDGKKEITVLTAEYSDETVDSIEKSLKEAKREKTDLEAKVSELNGRTSLSVEFEDKVYNDIYNI